MPTLEKIRGNLEVQLYELEALQAVYPEEVKIIDYGTLADINEFVSGNCDVIPQKLEYSVVINTPEGSVDLQINLPLDYPVEQPEFHVHSSLHRKHQSRLNEALREYAEIQATGEPLVHLFVTWLKDHLEKYIIEARNMDKKHFRNIRRREFKRKTTTTFAPTKRIRHCKRG